MDCRVAASRATSRPSAEVRNASTVHSRPFFWVQQTPRYCNSTSGFKPSGQSPAALRSCRPTPGRYSTGVASPGIAGLSRTRAIMQRSQIAGPTRFSGSYRSPSSVQQLRHEAARSCRRTGRQRASRSVQSTAAGAVASLGL